MPDQLFRASDAPLSLESLLLNLLVGFLMAIGLKWHYRRFGSTLSNREEFSQIFPLVLLTTTLIISIVRSSLALSLGLVGALSIVRFRTPIKEPEELAYLFISIAIGLGLGAAQTLPTLLGGVTILAAAALLRRREGSRRPQSVYLTVDLRGGAEAIEPSFLKRLIEVVRRTSADGDMRRFDLRDDSVEVDFLLSATTTDQLNTLAENLRSEFPGIGVTFLDQNHMPSV